MYMYNTKNTYTNLNKKLAPFFFLSFGALCNLTAHASVRKGKRRKKRKERSLIFGHFGHFTHFLPESFFLYCNFPS